MYENNWNQWVEISKRQKYVTKYLFPEILKYFDKNKPILELGAGVGQLCQEGSILGYKILCTDYCQKFIKYMKKNKILCEKIDATNISRYTTKKYSQIYAQGLTVLITKDMSLVKTTYQSIFAALEEQGKFILIFPRGAKSRYSRAKDHNPIYTEVGFQKNKLFRQQAFPSPLYKYQVFRTLENILGKYLGIRDILILEKR